MERKGFVEKKYISPIAPAEDLKLVHILRIMRLFGIGYKEYRLNRGQYIEEYMRRGGRGTSTGIEIKKQSC